MITRSYSWVRTKQWSEPILEFGVDAFTGISDFQNPGVALSQPDPSQARSNVRS